MKPFPGEQTLSPLQIKCVMNDGNSEMIYVYFQVANSLRDFPGTFLSKIVLFKLLTNKLIFSKTIGKNGAGRGKIFYVDLQVLSWGLLCHHLFF